MDSISFYLSAIKTQSMAIFIQLKNRLSHLSIQKKKGYLKFLKLRFE